MTHIVELRSDTFTRPTEQMRAAMADAEVGDDVWNEDPTVHRLEARAAELTGKQAAVFVASGTQGNLLGLLSHTSLGDEAVVGDQSHILRYEVAGAAAVGGIQLRTYSNATDGRVDPDEVRRLFRHPDVHEPRTGVVAIENSHNRCGGRVLSPVETATVADVAHEAGIPVHLDGARIFNSAVALNVSVRELVEPVDSVTFCLSKGLGAPIGSVLCGTERFIERARRWRKMLGGGMRQVGILAAAGIYALDQNVDRLRDDQAHARLFAEGIAGIPGISVDPAGVQTNMVFFGLTMQDVRVEEFIERLARTGVRVAASGALSGDGLIIRAVTSLEVNRQDIEYAIEAVAEVARELEPAAA